MSDRPAADVLDSADAGTRVVRGGALRLAGYLGGTLLSLVSSMVLFRALGVQDGGRFVTVVSLALLAAGVTDAGLTSIGVREHATRAADAERREVLRDLLGLRIALTSAGVVVAVGFAAVAGYDATLVLGTAIMGAAVLATAVQHALGVGLVAELRQGWVTTADVVRQGATLVAVAALAVAGAGLVPFWGAQVLGALAGLVAMALVVRASMPLLPAFDLRRWRALLRDTVAYALAAAVAVVYFRLAIILLSLTADATQTGYFAAAFRGVEVLIVIPGLLGGAAFPVLARAGRDDHARLASALGRVLDVSLVGAAGVALLLGVGAPVVMDVVGGADFGPAADVLRVQAVGLAASFLGAGVSYALLSLRRHRALLVANLAALVSCATLVPLLADAHGATGAAVATSISEWLLLALLAVGVVRAGIPLRFDRGRALRVLAAAALGLAPAALTGLPVLVRTLLCAAVFVAALVVLRALPRELRAALRGSGG